MCQKKLALLIIVLLSSFFSTSTVIAQNNTISFKNTAIEKSIKETLEINGDIQQADLLKVKYLDLRGKQLSDISDLSKCTNIEYIDLNYNQISDLGPLEKLTMLKYVTLNSNRISNIGPLKDLKNLEYVSLTGNKITDISDLAKLKKLTFLDISSNAVRNINVVKELISLKSLSFPANKVSDLTPIQYLKELKVLYATDNLIKDISIIKGLTNLVQLNLSGNEITDFTPINAYYDFVNSDVNFEEINRKKSSSIEKISTYSTYMQQFNALGLAYSKDKVVIGNGVTEDFANWKDSSKEKSINQYYDGEKFVQVNKNIFSYSYDGLKWVDKTIKTDLNNISFQKLLKVKGIYYAVGFKSIPASGVRGMHPIIASSKDGVNWSLKEFKEYKINSFDDICWNGNSFIVTGGDIFMSTNGIDWKKVLAPPNDAVDKVTWDGKRYVAVARNYSEGMTVFTSVNGTSWKRTLALDINGAVRRMNYYRDLFWDGKSFYLVTWFGLLSSTDAITWKDVSLPIYENDDLDRIIKFKNSYYIFGFSSNGVILESEDCSNWKILRQYPKGGIENIISNGRFFVGKDSNKALYFSEDRENWARVSLNNLYRFEKIANLNGRILAFGTKRDETGKLGNIAYSTEDGVNWNEDKCNIDCSTLTKVVWDGNKYTSLLRDGKVYMSSDSINWVKLEAFEENTTVLDFCYDRNKYVFLAYGNIIFESEDLKSFKKHSLKIDYKGYCQNIVSDGNAYYLADEVRYSVINDTYADSIVNNEFYNQLQNIKVFSSTDLDNWDETLIKFNTAPRELLYVDKTLYIRGEDGIFQSQDGKAWSRAYYTWTPWGSF